MNLVQHWFRAAATSVVVASLLGCGQQVELMAGLPATEANEIMAALQNAGVAAQKIPAKEGLATVKVNSSDVGRAVEVMREKGLPRERFAGMGQVFKKEGLISSPLEERARYVYALSQELSSTLSQIDGVVVARVHVVLPDRVAVGESIVPSSAAVFIKHQDGYNLDTLQPLVRRLVANSIPGLTPEKVAIVLVGAQPSRAKGETSAGWGGSTAMTALWGGLLLLTLGGIGAGGYVVWRRGGLDRFLRTGSQPGG